MKIYKVIVANNKFEYSYISDSTNITDLNKILLEYPILGNDDLQILKKGGGTIIYRDKDEYTYIINLDFILDDSYRVFDNYLYDKFESFRNIIKRDLKLKEILE